MACVAGVLVTMLSETAGLMRVFRASGDPTRAIVLSARALNEFGTALDPATVATILDAPGIARAPDGHPVADAEILVNTPPAEGFAQGSLDIRGIGARGLALRPELRIVAGRMFATGRQELIVGAAAERAFHFKVGDQVIMPDGEWPIVGAYTGGGILESQLLGDAATLMAATRKVGFGSVVVRLTNPTQFAPFERWLASNPTLAVTAERQADYYDRIGGSDTFFRTMAYLVAVIMSIGALFGAVNILYSAVRVRTREIATLRALGYEPLPLAASVIIESMLLSLTGAAAGCTIGWLLFNGHESVHGAVFHWTITPRLVALGLTWTLALAVLGSLLPARRAARLPVSRALQE